MIDVDISDKLTPDKEPTMAANTPEYKRLNKRKEVLKETIGEIKEAKQDRRDTAPGGVTEKRKVFAELGEKRKLNRVVEVSRSKRDKKPIIIQVSSSHNLSPRQMFNLEVDKSTIRGKDVGEGVFNSGKVIPESTVFGPYTGNFITVAEYEEMEKAGLESGNAWEIRDKDNEKTVGYIGPGIKPDSTVHWMAKVNCATTAYDQNLVGFQLAGQVYYRAIVDIELGGELMVFYGETYASEMGINVKIYEKYVGKEDQTKEAVSCKYCKSTFEDEKKLEEHLEKGKNMAYRCGVKQTMEMVRMAEVGDRRYVCRMCGKGFKSSSLLNIHGLVHSKLKAFLCKVAGCGKAFTGKHHLDRHQKVVHDCVGHECTKCGEKIGQKGNVTRHYKMVHLQEKPFKCDKCGTQFSSKARLTSHTITVHKKIKSFKCDRCDKRFGQASNRKSHIESVHSHIRYPCTWCESCSHLASSKKKLKYHIRRNHTKEWSWECQLCKDQLNIWWGCILPGEMRKHKANKHPVEWEEEQEAYRRSHPFICKYKKCGNRFASKVEVDRHQEKLHEVSGVDSRM